MPDIGRGNDGGDWRGALRVGILLLPVILIPAFLPIPHKPPSTWLWATLLPLVLGVLVAWQYERIFVDVREWVWGMEVLTYLRPLEVGGRGLTVWMLTALGGIVTLLEGAAWLGWIFLFGLVLLLWR